MRIETKIHDRHRHRYEVNDEMREELAAAGLTFSGISPDGRIERVISPKDVKTYLERQAQRTGTVS